MKNSTSDDATVNGMRTSIEPEADETRRPIHPGAGGPIEIEADLDDFDEETDSGTEQPGKIKLARPRPREFYVIDPDRMVPVRLLIDRPGGEDAVREEYYYVAKPLRSAINDTLKSIRIYLIHNVD